MLEKTDISLALARLRAKRKGHRSVVTRNINEAKRILEEDDISAQHWNRLKIIEQVSYEKLELLTGFDDEITQLCEMDDIEQEIELADEIRSVILETKGNIAIALASSV